MVVGTPLEWSWENDSCVVLVHYHPTGYSTDVEASERFVGQQQGTSSENLWIL